jgi:hypothetical protein
MANYFRLIKRIAHGKPEIDDTHKLYWESENKRLFVSDDGVWYPIGSHLEKFVIKKTILEYHNPNTTDSVPTRFLNKAIERLAASGDVILPQQDLLPNYNDDFPRRIILLYRTNASSNWAFNTTQMDFDNDASLMGKAGDTTAKRTAFVSAGNIEFKNDIGFYTTNNANTYGYPFFWFKIKNKYYCFMIDTRTAAQKNAGTTGTAGRLSSVSSINNGANLNNQYLFYNPVDTAKTANSKRYEFLQESLDSTWDWFWELITDLFLTDPALSDLCDEWNNYLNAGNFDNSYFDLKFVDAKFTIRLQNTARNGIPGAQTDEELNGLKLLAGFDEDSTNDYTAILSQDSVRTVASEKGISDSALPIDYLNVHNTSKYFKIFNSTNKELQQITVEGSLLATNFEQVIESYIYFPEISKHYHITFFGLPRNYLPEEKRNDPDCGEKNIIIIIEKNILEEIKDPVDSWSFE